MMEGVTGIGASYLCFSNINLGAMWDTFILLE